MNRVLTLTVLFAGLLLSVNKTDAAVKNTTIFKGLETIQNSPWDPREGESPTDDTGREDGPSQTEE